MMKKTCLCLIAALLAVLFLAACQAGKTTDDPETSATSAAMESPNDSAATKIKLPSEDPVSVTAIPTAIELTAADNASLTNRQIIDGLLAGDRYTYNGWPLSSYEWENGWVMYHDGTGANGIPFHSEHAYPYATWTPELILESYENGSAPWLETSDPLYEDVAFRLGRKNQAVLFSQDYNYTFIITNDGWLTINGINVIPFQCQTFANIDPLSMSRLYRAGRWDGSRVWSEDFHTSIELDSNLKFDYTYYTSFSKGETEYVYELPESTAGPWWENQTQYEIEVYGEPGDRVRSAHVYDVYPNLPNSKVEGCVDGEFMSEYAHNLHGTSSVITTAGPYFFLKGEQIEHWDIPVDPESGGLFVMDYTLCEDGEHIYFYDGHRLLGLYPDGEYEVLYDNLCGHRSSEGTHSFFYLEDGAMKGLSIYEAGEIRQFDVITDRTVVAANRVGLQFADDPTVYYLEHFYSGGKYDVTALGPGTVEEYEAMWHEHGGRLSEFIEHCQAQNGLTPAA